MDRDVTVTDNNIDVITCEVYILPKSNLFLTLILIPSPEDRLKNFLEAQNADVLKGKSTLNTSDHDQVLQLMYDDIP